MCGNMCGNMTPEPSRVKIEFLVFGLPRILRDLKAGIFQFVGKNGIVEPGIFLKTEKGELYGFNGEELDISSWDQDKQMVKVMVWCPSDNH